ncbi:MULTISPECIES: hypothetical protein [Vibrio]|uniref:hypothetical protein n=1 Tax=Vibrio TaxID=662 RepID=UPI0022B06FC2|nr:hypothetical protein [Vibrio atlanticus]MCZ4310101.1 hypothetical protein [Vibrio atlanticus]
MNQEPVLEKELKQFSLFIFFCLLVWCSISYFVNKESTQGVFSAVRLLISSCFIYYFRLKINRNVLCKIIIYLAALNGFFILIQVLEQTTNLYSLPVYMKYGGLWGYDSSVDYEPFRKGGLIRSSQVSSLLSLFSLILIIRFKSHYKLLPLVVSGIVFGPRLVMIFSLLYVMYLVFVTVVSLFKGDVKVFLSRTLIFLIFLLLLSFYLNQYDIAIVHLNRMLEAIDVVMKMDAGSNYSSSETMKFYRFPLDVKELVFGNGHNRFHALGGNDVFYTRWYLQSGFPSLILILFAIIILFFLEVKTSASLGVVTLLMLIHSFKDEVLTSFIFFDFYLAYIFSLSKTNVIKGQQNGLLSNYSNIESK